MSRSFDGTSDYLQHDAAVVSALPITMACWCRMNDMTTFRVLMSMGDSTATTRVDLYTSATPHFNAAVYDTAGSAAPATSTTTPVAGVWAHVCGVYNSSTSRAIYVNGVFETQAVTAITLGTPTATVIGARYSAGVRGSFLSGLIADAAIWNVALAGSAISALALGVSPLLINSSNLCAYWPLVGRDTPELDRKRRYDLAVVGALPTPAMHMPLQSVSARRPLALTMASYAPPVPPPEQGTIIFNVL